MPVKLSIIVPAYNERDLLPACLDSVLDQTADQALYEVVVIDNNSSDGTAEIAREKGVRVVSELRKGYVYAVRKGVEASCGSILAFIDADSRADPHWLLKILDHFEADSDLLAVGGKLDFYGIHPVFYHLTRFILASVNVLPGNNMAVKREALDRIGGIDPNVNLSLDYWLTLRLRQAGRIKIDKTLVVLTSGRRFKGAFSSHLKYFANVISLSLFSRPLFFDFPDVRKTPAQALANETTIDPPSHQLNNKARQGD